MKTVGTSNKNLAVNRTEGRFILYSVFTVLPENDAEAKSTEKSKLEK